MSESNDPKKDVSAQGDKANPADAKKVPAQTNSSASDEPRISVYAYQSKVNLPNSIKNFIENCAKQKDAGNLSFEFQATESAAALTARLASKGFGIAVISAFDEKELQQVHLVLGKLSQGINQGLVRVLVVTRFNDQKTVQNLKVRGAYEILDFGMNVKSLTFKLNTALKLTDQQQKRSKNSKAKVSSVQESIKNDKKNRTDHSCSTVYEKSDEHAADFWILTSDHNVRYVMGRVVVELLGPGPISGHWTSTGTFLEDEPGWVWNPRNSDNSPFFNTVPSGRWVFYGRQPDFSWQTNLWHFVSKTPYLAFHLNGSSEAQSIRFKKENPTKFVIKKNITNTTPWMALIRETIDASIKQKDKLIAEKASSDYRAKHANQETTGKDYKNNTSSESKLLEGRFKSHEVEGKKAEDYVDEAASQPEDLELQLKAEEAREINDRTPKEKEKQAPFNLLRSKSEESKKRSQKSNSKDTQSMNVDEESESEVEREEQEKLDGLQTKTPHSPRKKNRNANPKFGASPAESDDMEKSAEEVVEQDAMVDSSEADENIQSAEAPGLRSHSPKKRPRDAQNKSRPELHKDKHSAKDSLNEDPLSDADEMQSEQDSQASKKAPIYGRPDKKKTREALQNLEPSTKDLDLNGKVDELLDLDEELDENPKSDSSVATRLDPGVQAQKKNRSSDKQAQRSPTQKNASSESTNSESIPNQDDGDVTSALATTNEKESNAKPAHGVINKERKPRDQLTPNPQSQDLNVDENKKGKKDSEASTQRNVGDLASDAVQAHRDHAAKSARFEVQLLSKNRSRLVRALPVEIVDYESNQLSIELSGIKIDKADTLLIAFRFVCDPLSISFESEVSVQSIEAQAVYGEACLAVVTIDAHTQERLDQIMDALTQRRELMMDFFRMARGEDKNEKAA